MSFLVDIAKASVWAVNALVGTATGGVVGTQEPPAKVVLVPPLFERDLRLRSRMAHSSYDFLFGKPAMRWLLTDYVCPGGRAWLHFRPAEDPRVSVSADLHGSAEQLVRDSTGSLTLRYQPEPEDPLTFFDIRAAARGGGTARARGCVFHPESGLGAWGVAPLVVGGDARAPRSDAELGLRYSTPNLTAGAMVAPLTGSVNQIWLAGHSGSFTVGVQTEPRTTLQLDAAGNGGNLRHLADAARNSLSYCLAYSPSGATPYVTAAGRGSFTAAVEVKQQRQLIVSFLYHMAVQRNVKNPFETSDVVGITNYIDIGLQVATDVSKPSESQIPGFAPTPAGNAALGVAWQVNKSVLVKGRLSTESAGAALALKSWWNPSSVFALSATYPFGSYAPYPKLGFSFGVENFGGIRYERSKDKSPQGSSIVQRHVALPADVRNHEGKGIMVPIEDMDNLEILGQKPRPTDQYL